MLAPVSTEAPCQLQVKVTSAEAVCSREGSLLAAKTTVQPYADEGFSQQTRYTREQAVQVIQAATRGYITRRQLKESRQLEEHAAVLIQVCMCAVRVLCSPAGSMSHQVD